MDIYGILLSKPHNIHHLQRYYRFIILCKEHNLKNRIVKKSKKNPDGYYMETHHICPKAPDLFPEYKNLRVYAWNLVNLTARQHFIAHKMLYKVYGGSQIKALMLMIKHAKKHENVVHVTSAEYENMKKAFRVYNITQMSGSGHWSHRPGKIHNTKISHPKGFKGKKHTIDSKLSIGSKQIGSLNHFYGKSHNDASKNILREKRKSKIWITNGQIDKQIKNEDKIPDGFTRGRTNGTARGKRWITNGVVDKQIHNTDNLPPGFIFGRSNYILQN